uniref:non-specific serine/threonine protein kinase n=2 Tax=Strigamia maritima TaxID=126957 RepID=T1J147_STRMM
MATKVTSGCSKRNPERFVTRLRSNTHAPIEEDPKLYCKGGYHPVKIGETFQDRYTVVRKLGWGNFSTVWLCWDLNKRRFIALKIARSLPIIAKAARHEIQLLKCVQNYAHKRKIVEFLDNFTISGDNGTHICIAFEVLNHNLLELIKESGFKGLPLNQVKGIIKQVLESLDYLHETCEIIHTDIKPENVCVDENQSKSALFFGKSCPQQLDPSHDVKVRITDLGNACFVNHHHTKVIQTRPYRSPEVILGVGYQSNTDIWSTACMAFELATGHYLFPPTGSVSYTGDECHLARIVCLLGDVPKRMTTSNQFFTAEGKLVKFPKINSYGLFKRLYKKFNWDVNEAREFAEFLLPMLAIDPDNRSSAKNALGHKWLQL